MRNLTPTVLPLLIAIAVCPAAADIIHVPGDYATIGEALEFAPPFDEVHVAPGVYYEHDLEPNWAVTLKGTGASPEDVVIDAERQGRVITARNLNWIENLSLVGGSAYDGGGIAVLDGELHLTDVQIRDCYANIGAGIVVRTGSLELDRCAILDNAADKVGGGLHALDAGFVNVRDCVFARNTATGYGGAWSAARSHVQFEGCTIVENEAFEGAEGASFDGTGATITRTISSQNTATYGNEGLESVLVSDLAGRVESSCSDRWLPGWPGYLGDQLADPAAGNIHYDPQFCDDSGALIDWLGLAANSPCLPENTGGCGLIGAFGEHCGVTATPDAPKPSFVLAPAYPNPFNPQTTIDYALDRAGPVKLVVYGLDGRRVATLVNEGQAAGAHTVTWAGLDDRGRSVASGVYPCRLVSGPQSAAIRMTLVK